jgi:3-deoxy-D-manno-octulosonate 8-phosphate phosphatase (KDO 8-P phosphatase)
MGKGELKDIRAIVMDVDGVLTDGKIILGSNGTEMKSFNVRDGFAITAARRHGIKIGFITSRKSEAVEMRGRELGVDYLFQGVDEKLGKLAEICSSEGITMREVCYIGDDLIDIPPLEKAGFPATVADAPEEVRSHASFISSKKGGDGAVREIIEHILKGQGRWAGKR